MSCATDTVDQAGSATAETAAMRKFVNTPEKAVQGELIIYVDDATARQIEASEVATRSGVTALDAVAVEIGAEQLKPVFNLKVNADRKRELGMHRWYTMTFSEDADLEAAATALASLSEVERVQFSTRIEVPKTEAVEVDPAMFAATRAAEMPFNDPMLNQQWHYNNDGTVDFPNAKAGADVNLFEAWKLTTGRPDVIVAVVDEGVCHEHEDLNANMHVNEAEANGTTGVDDDKNGYVDDIYGYNFVNGGKITWTRSGDSGHGTHVAGTVAAVNNNGIGVAGVAGGSGNGDGVRIMSIQIFDGVDNTGLEQNARGITYAADMGASVLQNSWGYPSDPARMNDSVYEQAYGVEYTALKYFQSKNNCPAMQGGVVIFAAGNEAKAGADYPGAYNEFLCVTAYGPDGLPTSYTNYNTGCNVAAPGGDFAYKDYDYKYDGCVLSTLPSETIDTYTGQPYGTSYGYMQGTSMACPHVSGIAALVLSYAMENGITLTNNELYDILASSVRNIDDQLTGSKYIYPGYEAYGQMNLSTYKGKMGTGKLDALMAIMNVRGAQCVNAVVGKELELNIPSLIGTGDIKVKAYNSYDISEETKQRLGIEKVEFFSTSLYLTCKNAGIGTITVKYIAGGDKVGGGSNTGGKLIEKEVVIVAREANDNGGWL